MDASLLETMGLSARQKLLGQAAQKNGKVVEEQICNLRPGDYGYYLFHSGDISAIIPAIKHVSPLVRKWAIKAFSKLWFQQSTAQMAIDAVGGSNGLADILSSLPFNDAKFLVSTLGNSYRGPIDVRTHTLDELASMLVPTISPNNNVHPVSRLGSTVTSMLLPSCSPSIVKFLLKIVDRRARHRLHRLIHTQPALVSELLRTPYDEVENPAVTFAENDLKRLFAMRSIREVPASPGTHWGVEQFLKLAKAPQQPKLVYQGDTTDRITLGAAVLRNTLNEEQWCQVLETLIDISKAERALLSFATWAPIIRSITEKLARQMTQAPSHSLPPEKLCEYLREIHLLNLSGVPTGLAQLLPTIPQSVRNTLLRILHGLQEGHEWKFPEDAVKVSLPTVALLKRDEGEPLLIALCVDTCRSDRHRFFHNRSCWRFARPAEASILGQKS